MKKVNIFQSLIQNAFNFHISLLTQHWFYSLSCNTLFHAIPFYGNISQLHAWQQYHHIKRSNILLVFIVGWHVWIVSLFICFQHQLRLEFLLLVSRSICCLIIYFFTQLKGILSFFFVLRKSNVVRYWETKMRVFANFLELIIHHLLLFPWISWNPCCRTLSNVNLKVLTVRSIFEWSKVPKRGFLKLGLLCWLDIAYYHKSKYFST